MHGGKRLVPLNSCYTALHIIAEIIVSVLIRQEQETLICQINISTGFGGMQERNMTLNVCLKQQYLAGAGEGRREADRRHPTQSMPQFIPS